MIDIGSLLGDAATLMVTGMAFVFIFLTILVYVVRLMSRILPEEVPLQIQTPARNSNTQSASAVNPKIVAAISAAVHKHRSSRVK
ncbi:oxaloacetate decarboxylase subunit gamma [Vibrio sp. HA2012]|uniref:oxaloacetate decarboxylase subunit gamma n=1 Tax=Vibrio sp. HA2012 TaxID=1971595 RepID=UPI000C2CAEF6|nr:oxaloacetate decarboxylase subunit gamma [Vibrio sp. HA2012]PJC85962.1 oxaloacetate decarboxylase subunit gamma [Vibrio sp. HA2012]